MAAQPEQAVPLGKVSRWYDYWEYERFLAESNPQPYDLVEFHRDQSFNEWAVYVRNSRGQYRVILNLPGNLRHDSIRVDSLKWVWGQSKCRVNNENDRIWRPNLPFRDISSAVRAIHMQKSKYDLRSFNSRQ